MRYLFALELLVLLGGVGYLAWPDTPATSGAVVSVSPMLATDATAGVDWVGAAWYVSKLALAATPALLVICGVYLLIRALPRHLERRYQVDVLRAERQMPEALTHYTAPRLNVNYGSRWGGQATTLPPMLADTVRPLGLHAWFPSVAQHPAHILLLGETGSGKSLHARALLAERAKTDRIVVLDPHARYNDWCGLPAIGDGRNFDDIERVIRTLHAEFARRFQTGEPDGEPISVFIDEVPALADEKKDLIPLLAKWLREARKTGIRLVMLSTGWEVKALGIEGQGSVRENFLFLRLGNFATEVADIPPSVQYPAVLIRGRGKQEPIVLDTTGLPALTQPTLSPDVVWQPPLLELPATTTPGATPAGALPPADRRSSSTAQRILTLDDQGWSMRQIELEVFGYAGGKAHEEVKATIEAARSLRT